MMRAATSASLGVLQTRSPLPVRRHHMAPGMTGVPHFDLAAFGLCVCDSLLHLLALMAVPGMNINPILPCGQCPRYPYMDEDEAAVSRRAVAARSCSSGASWARVAYSSVPSGR